MTQQRQLKKQLRELKRIRTAVITGDETKYTERQLNEAIESVRVQLDTAEDRKVVIKMEKGRNKRMTKITVEQYKEYASQGLKTKEIASLTGLSEASIYNYKLRWKKAGLLTETPPVVATEKVSIVKPNELDRLTKINADLASKHELLKEENTKLAENNRLLTSKWTT